MRYKRLRRNVDYRLHIPELSGGVHPCVEPTLIDDDELSEACNVMWKQGALVTRPSLHADIVHKMDGLPGDTDKEPSAMCESICAHPFEIDGELCTVVIHAACYAVSGNSNHRIAVVTMDGRIKDTYTLDEYALTNKAVVPCDANVFGCPFLLYRGNNVYRPNRDTHKMELMTEEELYAPLVMINGKTQVARLNWPSRRVTGVMYEGFNRLSHRYRARFTVGSDSGNGEFLYMPTLLWEGKPVRVEGDTPYGAFDITVDPKEGGSFTLKKDDVSTNTYNVGVEEEKGLVTIVPPLPVGTISNNVTVTAYADGNKRGLDEPTIAAWFGGTNNRLGGTRLFLAGCEHDKARIMWSDVDNPLYIPENNYMLVGDPTQRVTALDKQDDMLVIFKERELYYTTYEEGGVDEDAVIAGNAVDVTVWQAFFPVRQLAPYIGCDCPDTIAVCNDRLVWMDSSGHVYTLASRAMYSERTVREIGSKILPYLQENTTEAQRKAASAADYDGNYWLFIGDEAYTFDYTDGAFLSVTSKTSADRIVWYRHRFDHQMPNGRQRIVSDGRERAVVFSTHHIKKPNVKFICIIYTFGHEAADQIASVTADATGVTGMNILQYPIKASFTTKAYTFGDPVEYKRIKALFLEAKAAEATVQCIADGQAAPSESFSSRMLGMHMVRPSIQRCRTMAVHIESTSPLCVRGLRVQYSPYGCVR